MRLGIQREPEVSDGSDQIFGALVIEGLVDERICAESIGATDVGDLIGDGQNQHRQAGEFRMSADPAQDFESIFVGHFEIEENQRRERMQNPVGVLALAAKVGEGLVAVGDDMNGAEDAGELESTLEEQEFIIVVLSNQDALAKRSARKRNAGRLVVGGHSKKKG